MKTTIIIPNYNGLSFMEPCFEALEKQTTKDFKILVVDNGSTDGSVEWLKEREIPSIFLPENTGFSGAVNVGIRAADTPYVILLNNDTKVAPHYVEALERAMDRYDPTVIGYRWDDTAPRIQLEPRGERGYIELRAVKNL